MEAIPGSGELDEYSKLSNDYTRKICVNYYVSIAEGEETHQHEHADHHVVIQEDEEEEEDGFSFACTDLEESSKEVFQFRQVYPVFDQSLLYTEAEIVDSNNSDISSSPPRPRLKKLFVEEHDHDNSSSSETDDAAGPYCEWSRKVVEASSSSQGSCKKSNSTGFSKIWRFRELVHRSSSDGKDAFVFFKAADPVSTKNKIETKENDKVETQRGTGGGKGKKTMTTSAHELHYVKNREIREEGRRRSYLPYRQGIVGIGFFTSVNGFTKNVHPY